MKKLNVNGFLNGDNHALTFGTTVPIIWGFGRCKQSIMLADYISAQFLLAYICLHSGKFVP